MHAVSLPLNHSRRSFLRGRAEVGPRPPRPPGAIDESVFLGRCTRCDDCLRACEPGILMRGDGGFPEVDLRRGGCTFCGACAGACTEGLIDGRDPSWGYRAVIAGDCLSATGVMCRSCGDACPPGAIRFRLALGGRAIPSIDPARCNGCGSCFAPCPVGAIVIRDGDATPPISNRQTPT